jgi:hexosaminidase
MSLNVRSQSNPLNIIPEPVDVQIKENHFSLDNSVSLVSSSKDRQLLETLHWFSQQIKNTTGLDLPLLIKNKKGARCIQFSIFKNLDKIIGNEGYKLNVTTDNIEISANTSAGIFYGLQTLFQLLPSDIESVKLQKDKQWTIPCVEITDYPRFGWRGLMLDVSRHFFTKEEVKKYIDQMVKYKYNVFHWHLSDDNGWRIEIKSLPLLTQTGAWRPERIGYWDKMQQPLANEPFSYGGFYTQDDIREIVAYAQMRNVTILPEIDVPAHSLALISAYSNLSCTGLRYSVNPGSDFYRKDDNALCIGNDSIFIVLDKIFTEVAGLFPGKYIHIGGDEAFKGFWHECPKCQKRMADEHLKNEEELQSFFIKKVEKILLSKGKKLIGWDEILQGGLAPEATVMSWRGMKGGIEAAKMNHHVVMTPWDFCYLDLYQGEPSVEPQTYGMCRLSDSYRYDPVPDSVDQDYILGGQANLWTEAVATLRHAEYMTWPRALALSEVYWSPKSKRDWNNFVSKMEAHFARFDAAQVKYARSVYNVIAKPYKDIFGEVHLRLETEISGLDVHYTFDNALPDEFYPQYKQNQVLTFPKGATQIRIVTYRDGKQIGAQICLKKEDLEKRAKEPKHEY